MCFVSKHAAMGVKLVFCFFPLQISVVREKISKTDKTTHQTFYIASSEIHPPPPPPPPPCQMSLDTNRQMHKHKRTLLYVHTLSLVHRQRPTGALSASDLSVRVCARCVCVLVCAHSSTTTTTSLSWLCAHWSWPFFGAGRVCSCAVCLSISPWEYIDIM
jgi:hypothetical protein